MKRLRICDRPQNPLPIALFELNDNLMLEIKPVNRAAILDILNKFYANTIPL